jgi:hypothetical protein
MSENEGPNRTRFPKGAAVIILIVFLIIVTTFIGYNISHFQQMNEEQAGARPGGAAGQ